jgi:hypothetical protein
MDEKTIEDIKKWQYKRIKDSNEFMYFAKKDEDIKAYKYASGCKASAVDLCKYLGIPDMEILDNIN